MNNHITTFLVVLLGLLMGTTSAAGQTRPITGKAIERFSPFDQVVQDFMERVEATSASLAISQDGMLLHSRGFGWRDERRRQPTPTDALFRIASISKPFTAAAIRAAAKQERLKLNEPMITYLQQRFPRLVIQDQRIREIIVEQLLQHQGGWDRKASFDVMFQTDQAARELKLTRAVTANDMARWGLSLKLDFAPGEKTVYSNYGYCLLGRVLEAALKKSYFPALNQVLLEPHGIGDVKLGRSATRDPREVWYNIPNEIRFNLDAMDAHGGLIASAPAICQFAERYHVTGHPRDPANKGYGLFFGSLPGTTAMMRQHPSGWNVVVLLNSRREQSILSDNDDLAKLIDQAIEGLK